MIKVAASVLAANPLRMGEEISRALKAGSDLVHFDVMDAHFVPNLSYGPELCRAIRREFPDLTVDVHLMMDQPGPFLPVFADAGADIITIHAEAGGELRSMLEQIRSLGCRSGLAIKPGTPVKAIRPLLDACDLALVMTVEPGFGGQKLMLEQLDKLTELRAAGFAGLLEADGGIYADNVELLARRGLDIAVMGSSMFGSADMAAVARAAHEAGLRAEEALRAGAKTV